MISFVVLAVLLLGYALAYRRFVPAKTRARYAASCRQDAAGALIHLIWITAAAQMLIAPSATCMRMRAIGVALAISGNALIIVAAKENPWFVATIHRPPIVIRSGIYKLHHPGYIGMIATAVGYFLLLGQSWAIVPTAGYIGLLINRMHIENKLLYGK